MEEMIKCKHGLFKTCCVTCDKLSDEKVMQEKDVHAVFFNTKTFADNTAFVGTEDAAYDVDDTESDSDFDE